MPRNFTRTFSWFTSSNPILKIWLMLVRTSPPEEGSSLANTVEAGPASPAQAKPTATSDVKNPFTHFAPRWLTGVKFMPNKYQRHMDECHEPTGADCNLISH